MPSDEEKKSKKSKKGGSKKSKQQKPDHQWWVPNESGDATHWWETQAAATAASGASQATPIDDGTATPPRSASPVPFVHAVPDVTLQIDQAQMKHYEEVLAEHKKHPQAAAAKIQRPQSAVPFGRGQGLSNYQKAKSDRNLPIAPPPPAPPSGPPSRGMGMNKASSVRLSGSPGVASFGNQSMGHLSSAPKAAPPSTRGMGMQAPAPVPRMQKSSSVRLSGSPGVAAAPSMQAPAPMRGMGMHKAQSVRIGSSGSTLVPPPPPPPPGAPMQIPAFGNQSMGSGMQAPAPRMGMTKASSVRIGSSGAMLIPPPPPPPPPPVVAEGVPLVPNAKDKAKADKKKAKEDKKKKKDEQLAEVFEDEPEDDCSVSEHREALDADEKAELAEQKVKKSLFFAILSACGLVACMQIISRLMARASGNGDDYIDADDAMNVANATPVPTPTGAEGAVANTAVAQQMAVAASQGAAAGAASGSSAAAAAGVVSVASLATVTSSTTAAGMVTVTGVGMVTGVIPIPDMFPIKNPCHEFIDEMTARPGYLNLHLEGLPHNFFSINKNTPAIEMAFTESFNKAIGVCMEHFVEGHNDSLITDDFEFDSGFYARYMENATLAGWDYWEVVDQDGNTVNYYTTEWTAFVGCDDVDNSGDSLGCSPIEPLFYEGDRPEGISASPSRKLMGDTSSLHPMHRWLQDSSLPQQTNLQLFMDTFSQELQELVMKLSSGNKVEIPTVFYGESLEVDNAIIVVEKEGTKYNGGHLVAGGTPDGAIDRPHGLPSCVLDNGLPSPTVALKEGYVQLSFLGLEQAFVDEATEILQEEFRSIYNDVMGECDGVFSRVLEKAKLLGVSEWQEQGQTVLSTNWSAIVSCDGCEDYEPLFVESEIDAAGSGDRSGRRRLEVEEGTPLGRFANAFANAITDQYQKQKKDATADVYYAAVLDQDLNVVEDSGDKEGPFVLPPGTLVDCATEKPPTDIDALDGGKFQLSIKNLVKDMNQAILTKVMQDVYNDVTQMCDGPLQRVAHRVTIDSMEHVVVDDTATYIDMNMTAKVTCTGCEGIEELLFLVPDANAARRHRFLEEAFFEQFQSKLTFMINDQLLTNFESSDYYEEGVKLFESSDPNGKYDPVEIAYGATYDRNGQVHRHTGQAIHNKPAAQEHLAGPDVIIAVDVCENDLKNADNSRDDGLQKPEYFDFVVALFASMHEGQSWPQSIGKFVDLPVALQDNFAVFAEGGVMPFGQQDEAARIVRLEAICYYTSWAIQNNIEGVAITEAPTAPPTTAAPTTDATTPEPTTEAPTPEPTTLAPTVLVTSIATTASPSEAPTTTPAPTETPIVEITVAWRFNMAPNERDATDQEYQDLTERVQEFLKTSMAKFYEEDEEYTFEDIVDTRFVSKEYYDGEITGDRAYNLAAIVAADFVFRGNQPTARKVFEEKFDDLDLEEFGKSLWVREPQEGEEIWVFDNVLGVTVNAVVR